VPIVGFIAPDGKRVPLDDDMEGFVNVMPPSVVRDIARRVKEDTRHVGTAITVTGGLGCTRELVLSRLCDVYADPTKMAAVTMGQVLHEWLAPLMGEEWVTEASDVKGCEFTGRLYDMEVSCRVDARTKDFSKLWDWKASFSGGHKFVERAASGEGVAGPDHGVQLNLCRLLIEQATGGHLGWTRDMEMVAWVMSGQIVKTYAKAMGEIRCGEVMAGKGIFTVKSNFTRLKEAFKRYERGDDGRAIARDLPLAGMHMFKGRGGTTKCNTHCQLKWECDNVDGGV
jgi:hypothetical protein